MSRGDDARNRIRQFVQDRLRLLYSLSQFLRFFSEVQRNLKDVLGGFHIAMYLLLRIACQMMQAQERFEKKTRLHLKNLDLCAEKNVLSARYCLKVEMPKVMDHIMIWILDSK